MKIQYVSNTCDVDGIKCDGEIGIFYNDGKIVHHHDYSDGALEMDSFESLLESLKVELTFESIEPTRQQIKEINKYLSENGYSE